MSARPAWAVNYCPGAFNSEDCTTSYSTDDVCVEDSADYFSCNLATDDDVSSELVAALGYASQTYSIWGHVGTENFCCHFAEPVNPYNTFKVSGGDERDVVKLTYTSGTEYNMEHTGAESLTAEIDLNNGDDAFTGSNSTSGLYHDLAYGGPDDDVLTGGGGKDELHGDAGADTILGGPGDDKVYGGDDADTIVCGAGDDEGYGEGGADLMSGGDDDDSMDGGTEADGICGGAGYDNLFDGDATSESPAYDQLWDLNTADGWCDSTSTRYGGGGVSGHLCSSTTLTTAPACP